MRYVRGHGPRLALYLPKASSGGNKLALTPLLVVHSVNAAASAAEVRPIFDWNDSGRRVAALELPGFGASQRGPLHYTPQLMSDAILRAAVCVQEELGFDDPIDLMGVSLSCEFAARAVLAKPALFRSLALVSPTGLESQRLEAYEQGRSKDKPFLRKLLGTTPWAEPVFRLLTRPASVRKFLQRTWGSPTIDGRLWAYGLLSARRPGAMHAPYAFIAGALFTRGVAELYRHIRRPVWVAHGVRGSFTRFEGIGTLGPPPNWTRNVFETGALPYFEVPGLFRDRYEQFLRRSGSVVTPMATMPA